MLKFDHATLAVRDIDATRDRMRAEGLAAGEARPETEIGTRSYMVPLGSQYIELVTVVDADKAKGDPFGRELLELVAAGDRWCEVCVADDEIEATAARLAQPLDQSERVMPDGVEHRWRSIGLQEGQRDASMPFFIEWDLPAGRHPSELPVEHEVEVKGIAWVAVSGDSEAIRGWIGESDLDLKIEPGEPRIVAIAIATDAGEVVLRSADA